MCSKSNTILIVIVIIIVIVIENSIKQNAFKEARYYTLSFQNEGIQTMRTEKKNLTIRILPTLHEQGRYVCFKKRTTFQAICEKAIKQAVRETPCRS